MFKVETRLTVMSVLIAMISLVSYWEIRQRIEHQKELRQRCDDLEHAIMLLGVKIPPPPWEQSVEHTLVIREWEKNN